ncbi:MAG: substrate-binding domain-containing protein [Kiritimatiellae bacterium]|nr:substrate-binding domain-containing protein [Kiritimatiellia bacterium]
MREKRQATTGGGDAPRLLRIGVWARQRQRWGRDLIAGAFRHANREGRCEIRFFDDEDESAVQALRQWRPDGLVLGGHIPARLRAPHRLHCPAALVNFPSSAVSGRVVAELWLDDGALARDVAERFLRRGFGAFAWVGTPGETATDYSARRRRGFLARLHEAGETCAVYRIPGRRGRDARALEAWLSDLPKPCGLMASDDMRGKEVLDACRRAGLRVPGQIAVVAVDDDTLFCETCDPPLSSVRPDHEMAGFLAAQRLCEAIESGSFPEVPARLSYGAAGFSERASSQDWRGGARLVSAARAWIAAHVREGRPIRAAEIAAALNVSVRLLNLRFRETGGGTLREAVEEARLSHVCERLRASGAPVDAVAAECGFASLSHLSAAFRNRYGLTPARWRLTRRPDPK